MIGYFAAALAALLVNAWLIIPNSPQLIGQSFRRVSTQEKVVALTYDDGPDPEFTPAVLRLLERHEVSATFFLMGQRVQQHPDVAQNIWRAGHEIGNHSWSHCPMILKSESFVREEIEKTDAILREIGYDKEIHFRAPNGLKYWTLPKVLSSMGKVHILFDAVGWDWSCPGCDAIVKNVMSAVRPGSIILLHDGCGKKDDTVAASEIIITKLKQQGYKFVTVSELLLYVSPTRLKGTKVPKLPKKRRVVRGRVRSA